MFSFPAKFEQDGGGYVVTFRDIPEAITQGDDLQDARAMALDALITSMDFYIEDERAVPTPSACEDGEELVTLPLSVQAKVLLLNALVEKRMRPSDLASGMGISRQEVHRILNLHHTTKIDTLAKAFKATGHELQLQLAG